MRVVADGHQPRASVARVDQSVWASFDQSVSAGSAVSFLVKNVGVNFVCGSPAFALVLAGAVELILLEVLEPVDFAPRAHGVLDRGSLSVPDGRFGSSHDGLFVDELDVVTICRLGNVSVIVIVLKASVSNLLLGSVRLGSPSIRSVDQLRMSRYKMSKVGSIQCCVLQHRKEVKKEVLCSIRKEKLLPAARCRGNYHIRTFTRVRKISKIRFLILELRSEIATIREHYYYYYYFFFLVK